MVFKKCLKRINSRNNKEKKIMRLNFLKRTVMVLAAIPLVMTMQSCSQKSDSTEAEIEKLVSQMTLEEKIGMLHGNSKFTSAGVERLGIKEIDFTDGPHGVREELERDSWKPAGWTTDTATYFPTGTAIAATWNTDLAFKMGVGLGKEARFREKDILLGPAVNIQRTPLCGRTYEYYTEDPYLCSRIAVNYIKGVQSCDVAACVKHFAVNNQETDRGTVDVAVSDRALNEIYLPAFKAAVTEAGVYTLMGAYNRFRGAYCCENNYLLNNVLRDQWGFDGFVVSDWDGTHSSVASALGGLDIEMGTKIEGIDYNKFYMADSLLAAVKRGEVEESVIDKKVANILRVLFRIKALGATDRQKGELNSAESHQTAYQIASEAITLIKNENAILPIDTSKVKRIAVIGDNSTRCLANGGFGAGVKSQYEVTPLQGLQNRLAGTGIELVFVQGYEKKSKADYKNEIERTIMQSDVADYKLINEAVAVAKSCDMAIIFGGHNLDQDTEATDRKTLKMPYGQDSLIAAVSKANKNTVMVVIAGSPVDLKVSLDNAKSVVYGWLNGCEGGNAMADVLLGRVNPSGKLPFSIPAKLSDLVVHEIGAFPGVEGKVDYSEGVFVGYRGLDTKGIEPLVPFGFGLSYTDFDYADLKTDKDLYSKDEVIKISFSLTNAGNMAGAEVVQVYVADKEASVERPAKELRAFAKPVLQQGETKIVEIEIPVKNLAFYDEKISDWNVESGEFELMIASSSRNIRLAKTVNVE